MDGWVDGWMDGWVNDSLSKTLPVLVSHSHLCVSVQLRFIK